MNQQNPNEIILEKGQLKLLKKIHKIKLYEYVPSVLPETETLHYLSNLKLIRHTFSANGKPAYIITELGKAKIHVNSSEKLRFWLPMTVSVIALIVSIVK